MSRIAAENRRVRRIEGTKVSVLHESGPGGMRKMRCPTTHQLATQVLQGDGSTVMKTAQGVTYVSKKLGKK